MPTYSALLPLLGIHPVLSPNQTWMALPGREHTVEILDATSGHLYVTYYGHQEGVHHLVTFQISLIAWISDQVCLSVSTSGSIHLWNARTGVHLQTLQPSLLERRERRIQ